MKVKELYCSDEEKQYENLSQQLINCLYTQVTVVKYSGLV